MTVHHEGNEDQKQGLESGKQERNELKIAKLGERRRSKRRKDDASRKKMKSVAYLATH